MEIRPAGRADLGLLAAIEESGDERFRDQFGYDPGWPAAPSGERRARLPGFLLVADDGADPDAPVGLDTDVIGFVHVLEADGLAHLEQISVRRDRQQRGTGRALVAAAKEEAARRGHGCLSLMTYADVPWNAPFYATCGFAEVEPITPFHRRLVTVEGKLGLGRHGRRVLMVTSLTARRVTSE